MARLGLNLERTVLPSPSFSSVSFSSLVLWSSSTFPFSLVSGLESFRLSFCSGLFRLELSFGCTSKTENKCKTIVVFSLNNTDISHFKLFLYTTLSLGVHI